MKQLGFEWDDNKNHLNKTKHGVGFEEAVTVFFDDRALVFDDPDHSDQEERFLIIGMSNRVRTLIVSHCFREREGTIRIISARKATKTEALAYYRRC